MQRSAKNWICNGVLRLPTNDLWNARGAHLSYILAQAQYVGVLPEAYLGCNKPFVPIQLLVTGLMEDFCYLPYDERLRLLVLHPLNSGHL